MNTFIKVIAGALVTVLLCLQLNKHSKDFSFLLGLMVCCMILVVTLEFLQPLLGFLQELDALAGIEDDMLKVMIKTMGISFLAEVSGAICADSGNSALGKTLQFCANCAILWLAIPLFQGLLDLVKNILVNT